VRVIPAPIASAPMPAPANDPMLQEPCRPDINIRPPARSTVMAWVFMATSSEPWNAPHTNSAPSNAGRLPVRPTSGPAAQ
jgi:hypothetical protein